MNPVTDPALLAILEGDSPQGGPVLGPAPKPEKPQAAPSGYRWDGSGGLVPIPGGPADKPTGSGGKDAPSGYRWTGDGNLEAIPGGPAERGIAGNSISQAAYEKAEGYVGQFNTLANALDTFQDDFGGNWLGGLENTAQAYSPVPVGTPGQSEWWSNFKALDNQIRNDLFGSALTPTEKRAYSDTTVEPGMTPEKIKANLQRRLGIIEDALKRRREFFLANGFKPDAVNAIFSPLDQRQAPAASSEKEDTPPAFLGPLVNQEGQVAGNTHDNGDSGAMGIAQGETRREDDPTLAGVRDEYIRRLGSGASAGQLIAWARSAGITDPTAYRSIAEQVKFRDENPGIAMSEYDTSQLDDRVVPITDRERGAANSADSVPGAYFMGAADAATGFNLDSIIGMTGGNAERARLGMNEVAERNPGSSLVGALTGGTLAALAGEAAIGSRIAGAVPRAFAADGAYGAIAGAGQADYAADGSAATMGDRAMGAATGTLAGLVGSGLGQGTGKVMQSFARGVSDPSVTALREAGVDNMTLGQMVANSGKLGAAVKGAEDRLSGLPVVGDIVNPARARSYAKFNSKAFDKALEPIGGTVGDLVGEEAVEQAQQQVSEAFGTVLRGKAVVPDEAFDRDLTNALTQAASIKRLGPEVMDEIVDILKPYDADPYLSGEALQEISRSLRELKGAYRNDPLARRVTKAVDAAENAIFGVFDRQAAGTVEGYTKAKAAYRRVAILEDAVLRAKNNEGVFSTGQLGLADRTNSKKFDGRAAAARGDSPFHDFQRAGQKVLPNKVPDSGTVGRAILPLIGAGIIGGDAYAGDGVSTTGLTLGTIIAGAYTKAGQRVLTKGARGMKQGTKRRAFMESDRTRRALGAAGGAGTAAWLTSQP